MQICILLPYLYKFVTILFLTNKVKYNIWNKLLKRKKNKGAHDSHRRLPVWDIYNNKKLVYSGKVYIIMKIWF